MNNTWYLVKDFTSVVDTREDSPKLYTVYGEDIFRTIQDAKEKSLQIVIYEIGECLIDWS